MISSRKVIMLGSALAAFMAGLTWSDGNVIGNGMFSQAEARIGRPLTPMSYAGVARRTTRRAIVGGAVVGGAVAAGAYYAPSCVQVVDVYGQVVTRC